MIIISPDAYLAIDEAELNNPIVGIDSLVTTTNIAASASATDYPASNLANPATYLYWKASNLTAKTLTITLTGNAQLIDYVGIAKHNFGTEGVTVRVLGDSVEIVPTFAPADDTPLFIRFEADSYEQIVIELGAADTNAAQCAVVYCGTLMTLQRKIYVGHKPITINSVSDIVTGFSESGNFLGRVIVNESRSTSISQQNLTASWVRNYLVPFFQDAKTRPFFFGWRPDTYSDEVGFVWMNGEPTIENQRSNGMMQFSVEVKGIV